MAKNNIKRFLVLFILKNGGLFFNFSFFGQGWTCRCMKYSIKASVNTFLKKPVILFF